MAPTKIRLGTASPATQPTTAATLAELSRLARRAAVRHVDLLLLPEAYIGGYPRGSSFGCVVGGRSDAGRDEYLRYFGAAVDLGDTVGDGAGAGAAWVRRTLDADGGEDGGAAVGDGSSAETPPPRGDGTREELERIARETGVFLVTGCIEKAGGSLYCAVVYVCPRQGMIGKRRKVLPTGSERLIWAQGSPATLRAVTTTVRGVRINLAAAICWENYMPLLRQALYAQNVNLYLAPTADGRDGWLALLRTIGIEGRCFVVSSNMCVRSCGGGGGGRGGGKDGDGGGDGAAAVRRRRESCVTEDGFEIALPAPSTEPPSSAPATRSSRRRRSVFDEDGNEIVLRCDDDDDDESEKVTAVANGAPGMMAESGTPLSSSSTFISRGGSAIVSPFGDVLAGPQWEDDEGIICADVDFEDCIRGRLDLDAVGSYSRNDSFKFSVQGLKLTPLPY